MWFVAILSIMIALVLGFCVGAFAMFVVVRWVQIENTTIKNEDVGKYTWDVVMEQTKT